MAGVFTAIAVQQKGSSRHRLFPAPPELICFSAWVLWAVVTGPFVAVNMDMFWIDARKILQIGVMVWVIYGTVRLRGQVINAVPVAIICASLFLASQLFMNLDSLALSAQKEQADGGTGNANALGIGMVFAVFSFPLLWGFAGRQRTKVFIAGVIAIPLFGYAILASGSRKSILALLLLVVAWLILGAPARARAMVLLRIGALVLMGAVLLRCLPFVMDNTLVGQRFEQFMNSGDGSVVEAAEQNVRYQMYIQGLKMFFENPVLGVGVGNFRARFSSGHYSNLYSHSDYIEPLSTTGLPGFLLYQAPYFIIFCRAVRLIKQVQDEAVLYRLKMIIVLIITVLFLGFGAPFYTDLTLRVLLITLSVYTFGVVDDIRRTAPVSLGHIPRRQSWRGCVKGAKTT